LLSNPGIETNYKTFFSTIRNTLDSIVRSKVRGSYGLPWYTKGLQKIKNLRNKYYKKFSKTHNPADGEIYRQHKREIEFLNKFLYNQYICEVEHSLKANPKAFWRFVNSKKAHSSIPSTMSYNDVVASTEADIANLFAAFFSSNMETSDDWYDLETLNSIAEICIIGSLDISYDDSSEAISYFDDSPRLDFDGISLFVLRNCIASPYLPLQIMFSSSLS